MIQSNELRLGNLVYDSNKRERYVSAIGVGNTIWFDDKADYSPKYYSDHKNIHPIPLTTEWLEKFGFVNTNHGWDKDKFGLFDHNYSNKEKGLDLGLNMAEGPLPRIRFVHELQNLFFCLSGKELEVNNGI